MIYNQFGQAIPENAAPPPAAGFMFLADALSDRDTVDVSRGLTPRDVDRIMTMANGGDVEEQSKLACELPEKNADIAHAVMTRRNALLGCKWHVEPGDDSPDADSVAKALSSALESAGGVYPGVGRVEGFRGLLEALLSALLPGSAAAETVWKPGGAGFFGWRGIEPRFLSYYRGYTPNVRVKGNMSEGVTPAHGKLVTVRLGSTGTDPARGGLIRPLAWLHCFANLNLRDLLSFAERYGMPFVVAKIDKATYDREGTALNNLIRNFGPRGGGVFSRATEIQLLQAASTTGDIYFRLLEYLGDAITKVVLGQTASSGDSAGLSGGDAQSKVRQDILEADARAIEEAIQCDLVAPWLLYNYNASVPAPRVQIETEPPEDTAKLASTLVSLYSAGLALDPEEIGERMGLKLTSRPEPNSMPGAGFGAPEPGGTPPGGAVEMAETQSKTVADPIKSISDWLGPFGQAVAAAVTADDDELDRRLRDGLPQLDGKFGDSSAIEKIDEESMNASRTRGRKTGAK